jgi:hypothetical protein
MGQLPNSSLQGAQSSQPKAWGHQEYYLAHGCCLFTDVEVLRQWRDCVGIHAAIKVHRDIRTVKMTVRIIQRLYQAKLNPSLS